MGLEEEIYQAGNILEGAAQVVNKGLSIFDNIAKTFYPNPTPISSPDPGGELGGQEEISQPKTPTAAKPSPALLIGAGVLIYLLMR